MGEWRVQRVSVVLTEIFQGDLLSFFHSSVSTKKTDIPTGVSVAVDGRMIAMLVIETVRWSSCF
jgi:hypothetical protein